MRRPLFPAPRAARGQLRPLRRRGAVPAAPGSGSGLGALEDPEGTLGSVLGTGQARGAAPAGKQGDVQQHNQPGSCGSAGRGPGEPLGVPPGRTEPPARPGQAESGPRGAKRRFRATSGGRGCL